MLRKIPFATAIDDTVKNSIKNALFELFIITALTLMCFGVDYIPEYATDSYALIQTGLIGTTQWATSVTGRVIMMGFYYLMGKAGADFFQFYSANYILAIISLILSIFILENLLKNYITNCYCRIFMSFITIVNPLIIEYFMFVEVGCFMLSILFCMCALGLYICWMRRGQMRYLLGCIVFGECCVFTYQPILAVFVIMVLPFVLVYSDNIKKYIVHLSIPVAIYGVCGVSNALYLKRAGSYRVASEINFISSIFNACKTAWHYYKDMSLVFPKGLYTILILAVAFFCLVQLILNGFLSKETRVCSLINGINMLIIIIGTVMSGIALLCVGNGFWSPRCVYPLGYLVGILLINYAVNIKRDIEPQKITLLYKNLCLFFCGMLFLVELANFSKIFVAKHKNTALDAWRCGIINKQIREYEKENNIEVTTVAVYSDQNVCWPQYNLFSSGDLIVSSFLTSWSCVPALNYYGSRTFTVGEQQEYYVDYFSSLDWDTYSDDQLIFDGNILHLCVY